MEENWKEGDPKQVGWYDCIIDDRDEDTLYWWVCQMNPRKRYWKNRKGEPLKGRNIKWTGKPRTRP